jgi:hypothetical protein
LLDVVLELHLQRVDVFELTLASQKVGKRDPNALAIEVARKIKQVRF